VGPLPAGGRAWQRSMTEAPDGEALWVVACASCRHDAKARSRITLERTVGVDGNKAYGSLVFWEGASLWCSNRDRVTPVFEYDFHYTTRSGHARAPRDDAPRRETAHLATRAAAVAHTTPRSAEAWSLTVHPSAPGSQAAHC